MSKIRETIRTVAIWATIVVAAFAFAAVLVTWLTLMIIATAFSPFAGLAVLFGGLFLMQLWDGRWHHPSRRAKR